MYCEADLNAARAEPAKHMLATLRLSASRRKCQSVRVQTKQRDTRFHILVPDLAVGKLRQKAPSSGRTRTFYYST